MSNLDQVATDAKLYMKQFDPPINTKTPFDGTVTFKLPNHGDIVSCPLQPGHSDTLKYCNKGCPNRASAERRIKDAEDKFYGDPPINTLAVNMLYMKIHGDAETEPQTHNLVYEPCDEESSSSDKMSDWCSDDENIVIGDDPISDEIVIKSKPGLKKVMLDEIHKHMDGSNQANVETASKPFVFKKSR